MNMNTENLTNEQIERINTIKANFEKSVASINERRAYRMQNYYDCVDDYSWGGLCDKADDEQENRLCIMRDILIEEAINGGYHVETLTYYQLKDNEGNLCVGARNGQWGQYFVINEKYVGVPKRVATLEKKGYILEKVTRTFHCVFKRFSNKENYILYKSIDLVDEKVERVTQDTMPTYIGEEPWVNYLYESNKAA